MPTPTPANREVEAALKEISQIETQAMQDYQRCGGKYDVFLKGIFRVLVIFVRASVLASLKSPDLSKETSSPVGSSKGAR